MTVKDLLDHIKEHNIPMDAEVFYQRIEDSYFQSKDISNYGAPEGVMTPGWPLIKKPGTFYYQILKNNEKVAQGLLDKKYFTSDEEIEAYNNEYIRTHGAEKYPNDNNLYINAHY